MMARCLDPEHKDYDEYRDRAPCEHWRTFESFYADVGDAPDGMWLERYDNSRRYEPSNCGWATPSMQAANRRPRKKRGAS